MKDEVMAWVFMGWVVLQRGAQGRPVWKRMVMWGCLSGEESDSENSLGRSDGETRAQKRVPGLSQSHSIKTPTTTYSRIGKNIQWRDFPAGPVAKTPPRLGSQCEDPGSVPGQGTRFHTLQLRVRMVQWRSKIPSAATKAQHSQINK